MVRWLKLFGDQYFGFWVLGLVLFAIQEIPYMVMPLVKMEANPIMNMVETSAALDACEKILGSLCIALMIFVVHRDAVLFSISEGRERLFFVLAMIILMFFIVLMPPLYYVAIGLWRRNVLLAVAGVVFLAVHFLHVYGNLRE